MNKVKLITSIALLGYLANLLFHYVEYNMYSIGFILEFLNLLKPNSGLGFFMSIDPWPNFFNHQIYILDTILGLMLAFGIIQYIITKEKKYNLLTFSFSVIYITSFINILLYIKVVFIPNLENNNFVFQNFINTKFFIFNNICWALLSFFILRYFAKTLKSKIELDVTPTKVKFKKLTTYTILDLLLAGLVFTPLLMLYIGSSLHFLETIGLVKVSLIIMILISIFLYNILFDTQFGSTPGRFLSGMFLLDENQNLLNPKNSLLRTYYNITLNKKAETSDWNLFEIQDSEPKRYLHKYFLGTAIFLLISIFVFNLIFERKYYQKSQANREKNKYNFIANNLKYLNTTSILKLRNKNNSEILYLKFKEIEDDSITLDLLNIQDKHLKYAFQIHDYFLKVSQDSIYHHKIHKSVISEKNIGLEYSKFYPCNYNLKIDNLKINDLYCIDFLYNYNEPSLFLESKSISRELNDDNFIHLYIENFGSEGYITSLKSLQGNIRLRDELPIRFNSPKIQNSSQKIKIQIENYWDEIKLEILVENQLITPSIKQKYMVTGKIYSLEMERVQ